MKKKIIMKLAALFMTGILTAEAACAGIGANTVYAAETDAVESESDGADSEFTGASGTGWTLDADGLLTISGDPEYEEDEYLTSLDAGYTWTITVNVETAPEDEPGVLSVSSDWENWIE